MTTLKEVATEVGLPESTLRVYRDEFDDLIPAQGEGRRRRYGADGVTALKRVVAGKREGWDKARIREALQRINEPLAKRERQSKEATWEEVNARLLAQSGEIAALRAEVGGLRDDMRRLIAILEQSSPPAYETVFEGE